MTWGSIPGRSKRFILFRLSRAALEPTKPPIQQILSVFFMGKNVWGVKLKTYLHLTLRLRMSEAIPLLQVLAVMVSRWSTLLHK